ncbi:MAG TPA: CHAT domain-containing protein [Thermoanaerobaculia bacterium]|nr:CHAT domain-containing protein [Thermoanaerobaculia bacterium]
MTSLPRLPVELAGCETFFRPDGPCALGDGRTLTLWLQPPAGTKVQVWMGGRRLDEEALQVEGGQRFHLRLPGKAGRLDVLVGPKGTQPTAAWSVVVVEGVEPAWMNEVRRLVAQATSEARELAKRLLREQLGASRPLDRDYAADALALIEGEDGRPDESLALARQAVEGHRVAGRWSAEAYRACYLAHSLIQQSRFGEARQVLAELKPPPGSPAAEPRFQLAYHRGLLAQKTGDWRAALTELEAAVSLARRLGLTELGWKAGQTLALQLRLLGRAREAADLFARLDAEAPADAQPCDRAEFLNNEAWDRLLALEAEEAGVADPASLIEKAWVLLAEAERGGRACRNHIGKRANNRFNLALAHWHAGRLTEARRALQESLDEQRGAGRTPRLESWQLDLEGRLSLAEGRPELALATFRRLEESAESQASPDGLWRAAFGAARAQQAAGRADEALAALERAEDLSEAQLRAVPVHQGRESFLTQRAAATRLAVALLVAEGRSEEALASVRRARSSVLRALATRERFQSLGDLPDGRVLLESALEVYAAKRAEAARSAGQAASLPADERDRVREVAAHLEGEALAVLDQALWGRSAATRSRLPDLPAATLTLAFFPAGEGDSWWSFAADRGGVTAARVERAAAATPQGLASRLLEPFTSRIRAARRVRVLPWGELRGVDFHTLPFDGGVLLDGRQVVYGLDLSVAGERRAPPSLDRVLIVSDPLRNLPSAQREAEAVRQAVARRWPDTVIYQLSMEGARGPELLRSLPAASLLHFAGHGTFAGRGGWDSALQLAAGTRLTVGDVLALPRVPQWVVLSACEGAASEADAPLEGLSIAHAFVIAGSGTVLAATRPVRDGTARALFAELYGRFRPGADLAEALRQAQLALRERLPGEDSASFRVLEP